MDAVLQLVLPAGHSVQPLTVEAAAPTLQGDGEPLNVEAVAPTLEGDVEGDGAAVDDADEAAEALMHAHALWTTNEGELSSIHEDASRSRSPPATELAARARRCLLLDIDPSALVRQRCSACGSSTLLSALAPCTRVTVAWQGRGKGRCCRCHQRQRWRGEQQLAQ